MNQLVESIDSEGEEKYYYYDTWGNLISDGIAHYYYDHLNRLKEYRPFGVVDGTHYTYYIDNLRKSKDDTYFIWLDGNMVYEFTSTDSDTYTYGHRLISSDEVKYVLNAHGDVVALLNANGVVTKRYDYDAFGNELSIDNTDTNPFRYCAEYFDVESEQIYLRARYYSPVIGRFTQFDPIKDGLNWYAYCSNNPIAFVDRNGQYAETILDIMSLCDSYVDLQNDPNDFLNWVFFAWDCASVAGGGIPGSYTVDWIDNASNSLRKVKTTTNIAKNLSKVSDYKKVGYWAMGWADRGYAIEKALGGMCNNFPVIDKYVIETVSEAKIYLNSMTSIKSMDITLPSYQKADTLRQALIKYVNALADFSEKNFMGKTYVASKETERILQIAIPYVEMTDLQADVFQQVIEEAAEKSVKIIVSPIE